MIDNKKIFEDDLNDPHARFYFKLLKTASLIEIKVKNALKPYDLTHEQLNILSVLVNNYPNPLSASEIKENLIVNSPDLTRLIDKLVKKEYVKRTTCSENRRKIDVVVTQKGLNFFYEAHIIAKESLGDFLKESISVEEALYFHKILNRMSL